MILPSISLSTKVCASSLVSKIFGLCSRSSEDSPTGHQQEQIRESVSILVHLGIFLRHFMIMDLFLTKMSNYSQLIEEFERLQL